MLFAPKTRPLARIGSTSALSDESDNEVMSLASAPSPSITPISSHQSSGGLLHGGQEVSSLLRRSRFQHEFSVTLNFQGPPSLALGSSMEAMKLIQHYPPSTNEPALSSLAAYISSNEDISDLLILGNGASELIDLVTRSAPPGPWRPGPAARQYMEYQRSAMANDRTILSHDDPSAASIYAIVNPCNPTGDFFQVDELKGLLEKVDNGTFIIVDESMLPWHGPDWREQSLMSQRQWITSMLLERDIHIFVIVSWTKIWACPGLRLGSVLAPSRADHHQLSRVQVPWSVNTPALWFLAAAVQDKAYLEKTWELTPQYRASFCARISEVFPTWTIYGADWISWLWVDTHDEKQAQQVYEKCLANGCPIRFGGHGYHAPTFLRFGVRPPNEVEVLFKAIED